MENPEIPWTTRKSFMETPKKFHGHAGMVPGPRSIRTHFQHIRIITLNSLFFSMVFPWFSCIFVFSVMSPRKSYSRVMALERSPDLFFVIGYVKHNNTFETKIEAQQCSNGKYSILHLFEPCFERSLNL